MSGLRLDGKVAIITGGASGIGAEAARLFTEHGAKVVIVDLQEELGQKVAVSIGKDKAIFHRCDVTNETEVVNAVKFTVEKYGKLDVLFSNAGVMEQPCSILDLDLKQFDRTMAVNVRGAAAFIKHAARVMVEKGTRGSIICTTSVAAEIGGPGPHAYTASKHGLLGLVRTTCGGLGKYGIRVNGVAPYAVATPMSSHDEETARMVEGYCATTGILKGVVLKAHHVAQAALFLASDDSAYVSGQNLAVDGGYSVVKPLLDGKIVIITGGASGIGAESAKLFSDHGAKVVIVDVQEELGQNVAVSIGEDRASFYRCDITEETEVKNAVKFTVEKHGKLDVLFSNAGVLDPPGSILDLDLERFDRIMEVNVRGAAAFIKHAARAMVVKGTRGSIVCTTSVASEIGGRGRHGYTASKHGLLGLIRSACAGLGKYGIRVNGVAPYALATPMTSHDEETAKQVEEEFGARGILKGVVLNTHHVAQVALFLASDDSFYISGQNLAVDGGYTVVKPM
ncbi:unnamed protein product [Thlaspi arvense]|uniref:3-oxoacyl-[acyl-carrier-protein] reductase n=1 Tax=Thlaspi arvense TaxID=13288 RepID=A0AAU9S3G9_THLAR|nr:unnamed protein product [Thlaspi arvense]